MIIERSVNLFKGPQLLFNRPFHRFCQPLTWTSSGKSVDITEKSLLKLVKLIAKFEKDLLKANEDTAPQSCKILQTFVWLINFICQDIARTIAQNVLEAFQCFPQLVIRHFQQSVLEAIMKDSQWQRYSYWTRVWLILEGKNYFSYPAGRLF